MNCNPRFALVANFLFLFFLAFLPQGQSQNNINSLNATCGEHTFTSTSFTWDKPTEVDSFYIYDLEDNSLLSRQTLNEIGIANIASPGKEVELRVVPICAGGCNGLVADTISCSSTPCPNINVRINPKDNGNPNLFFKPNNQINYCFLDGSGIIEFDTIIVGTPTQAGRWESTGIIDDKGNFDVLASGYGIFQVRYVIDENEYCQYRDLYTIIVENLAPLDFEYDAEVCPQTPSLLKVPTYVDPRIVPQWIIEGGGVVNNVGLDSFHITWNQPGEYEVGLFVDPEINECLGDTIWHSIKVIEDLSTEISCTPFNDRIEYSWTSNSCFDSYLITVDGNSYEQSETEFTLDNLSEGQEVTIEILPKGSDCLCNVVTASSTCTTVVCDPIDVSIDNQKFFCDYQQASLQLNFDVLTPTNGQEIKGIWSGENISTDGLVDMQNLTRGDHTFQLLTSVGQCNKVSDFTLTYTSSPQFDIEFAGPLCGGDKGYVDIFPVDFQPDYEIYIDNILVENKDRYSIDLSKHEIYISDAFGCSSEVKTVDLSDFEPVSAKFNQKDNIIIQEEQEVSYEIILSNTNTKLDSIRWYYDDEMKCSGNNCDLIYDITPEESGKLCAEIFYDASCMKMLCSEIRVNKLYDYYIPNIIAISAGNEVNKSFTIFSEDQNMKVNKFEIYDQWGNRVYHKENTEKSNNINWTGEMNGATVESGVFAYVGTLEFSNGRILNVSGDVTVLNDSD